MSDEETEEMTKCFPECPLCGSDEGYKPSPAYREVVCKSCKAEWQLYEDGMVLNRVPDSSLLSEKRWDKKILSKKHPLQFWRGKEISKQAEERPTQMKGMKKSEYKACLDNLGLLEGEEMRLQYVCFRKVLSPPSIWDSKQRSETKKGLLVFTNDNMIFMQQEGGWSSNYAQALRFPLEQFSGVVSGGTLIKHVRITFGVSGASEQHEFINFVSTYGDQAIQEVRADIEKLLKEVREEKKRLAQEALAKGTVPAMVFCRFCGTRNKSDRSLCINCGAPLT